MYGLPAMHTHQECIVFMHAHVHVCTLQDCNIYILMQEIRKLAHNGLDFIAECVHHHEWDKELIMNSSCHPKEPYTIAAGVEGSCYVLSLRAGEEGEREEGEKGEREEGEKGEREEGEKREREEGEKGEREEGEMEEGEGEEGEKEGEVSESDEVFFSF